MKSVGQLLIGIITAAGSALLVLAAISLALVEGGASRDSSISPTSSPTVTAGILTPAGGVTLQPTLAHVITATLAPSNCHTPEGWVRYTVQVGDDLDAIAARSGLSTEALMRANCMVFTTLMAGTDLSVPFIATETAEPTLTPVPTIRSNCGAPPGWVIYTVKSGDTLSRIGRAVGVTAAQLQKANCLPNSTIITGMRLYVPFLPAPSPVATNSPAPSPSATVTEQQTVTETLPAKPEQTETATATLQTGTPEQPTTETPTVTLEKPTDTPTSTPTTPVAPEPVVPTPTATVKAPIK